MTDFHDPALIDRLLSQQDWVRALAIRLVGDRETAEDVAQETWLRALRRPPRHGLQLRAWLGTVVRSIVRERGRSERARRDRERLRPDGPTEEDADQLAQRIELQQELSRAVLGLPEGQREVVLLRFFGGHSVESTAERLGVSAGTVASRQHRALALLRQRLDARHGALMWPLVLRRWLSRESASATAVGTAATAAGAALMATTTTKLGGMAAAVVLVLGGSYWALRDDASERLDPPTTTAREHAIADGKPAGGEERADSTSARRVADADALSDESPPGSEPAAVDGLELLLRHEGRAFAASVVLFDDTWLIGPRSTDEEGRLRVEESELAEGRKEPSIPSRVNVLVLPPASLPLLGSIPRWTGRHELPLSPGAASLQAQVRIESAQPTAPLSFVLQTDRGLDWLAELPDAVRRHASLLIGDRRRCTFQTDGDGRIHLRGLDPGWCGALDFHPGFEVRDSSSGRIDGSLLSLDAPCAGLVVDLTEGLRLRGRIVDESGAEAQPGVRGWCMARFEDGRSSPAVGFETDSEGRFLVSIQHPEEPAPFIPLSDARLLGLVEVRFSRGGLRSSARFESDQIPLSGDLGDLVLAGGRSLRFRVIDPEGHPITDAVAWAGACSAPTGADGRGVLDDLSEQSSAVLFAAPGHGSIQLAPPADPDEELLVELSGTNLLRVEVQVAGGISDEQTLLLRAGPDLLDPSTAARSVRIAHFWGELFAGSSRGENGSRVSLLLPADGVVEFQELAPGEDCTLELHDPLAGVLSRVEVPGLRADEHRTVRLRSRLEPQWLRGKVIGSDGRAVGSATLVFTTEAGSARASSRADGSFELGPLHVAADTAGLLRAEHERGVGVDRPVEAGAPGPHVLRLEDYRSLRVLVRDEEGHEIVPRHARLEWNGQRAPGAIEADGTLLFRRLPPQPAATLVLRVGDQEYTRPCDTRAEEMAVELPVHAFLEVSVDPDAVPAQIPPRTVLRLAVRAEAAEREFGTVLQIEDDGRLAARLPLLPGHYELRLRARWPTDDAESGSGEYEWPLRQLELLPGERTSIEY